MKLASFHLITSILIFQWRYILCSHFRGGIITWKPVGNQIEITYRVAFRRNYSTSHTCFDANINNRIILQGEGNLECFGGCSGIIVSPMSYYCTDYSLGENWSAGSRVINYTFTSTNFQIGYDSCCWISTLNVGKDSKWRLFASANLQMRQDVGRINTSPVSGMAPIVRMKLACTYALRIPVEDDDGDIVKCRWANDTNSYAECYGVCHAVPGATIDEDSCILHWTPTGSLGWYAVAVQIEDYASSSATTPMSSVPLQFLLDVSALTGSCDDKPSIIPPSGNVNGTDETKPEVYLHKNDTYVDIIIANTGSTSISITEIITVSPVGMIKSPVTPYGDSGMEWYVNITWTPAPGQGGSHIFCYTAVNSLGQTSDQHCITIKVDEVDECLSNPCSNGGTCINDINRYRCTCPSSHTGIHCETDIDFCDGVKCLNGGTCMDGVYDYSCSCPASHTGVHCQTEIDFCDGVQCQSGGSCVDGLFDYACSCPSSHTGKNCEIDIDFCNGHACLNGGTCVDGAFDYTCVCPGSHSGYHCEKDIDFCVGVACQNGGSCVDGLFDYSCECLLSHTGKHCEDDIDFCNGITCLNGGTCIDGVFNYSCLCPASHTGGQCQTDIDFCVGVDCKNGGTCMDGLFDYSCSCPTSHKGKHCETDIDFCVGVACQNGGSCVDGLFDFSCACLLSHTGKHCEDDIDFCNGITCLNGGTCIDGVFNYSCLCPASHTGSQCQTDIDFCVGVDCKNGGTCMDGLFDYSCSCPTSHTGKHCETDIDFCVGVACQNGGSCVDGLFDFSCACLLSHTGKHCEDDIDFCNGITCLNGGTCIDGVFNYSCLCPASHTGGQCQTDIDLCVGVDCKNGGTCMDGLFDYSCSCPTSHTGKHCETDIDFCAGIVCQHEGVCVDGLFDYSCTCPMSHAGKNCETDIDFCEGITCLNGGTCVDGLFNYSCVCPASHTGGHCQTDVDFCQGVTCYNGGTCVDRVFDYNCMCPRSHTGDHCQTDVDFCQGVFCKNGGRCVDGLITFHCSCPTTHVGTYCEQGTDNRGKEFILGYIPNANTNDPILEIHITTEYSDVKVQISTPLYSNITHSITVTKGEVYKHVFNKDLQGISGSVENKGIYVKADADIVVHAINREDYSSDAFLVLPSDVLGLNHYIISYNDRSAFIVVGTENETDVSITISSTASGVVYNGNIYTSGQTLAVKLDAYQTLVIAAVDGDLTGSNVTGTKPLAVISGSICAKIGSGSCDHLVQQIPPVTRWGTDFVTFNMPKCSNSNSFRVVSSVANTVVSVQGFSTYTMSQPGSYKSFVIPNSESRTISASNPVAVAMFVNGNCNGTGTGDPTMILIPPISQFSNNFTFSTVDALSNDFENYVTIAIIDDFIPGLRLDNNALEVTKWKSVNGRNDMKITHLKIESGAHSLRNIIETVTFMTIVTGTQSFNSYGYPAGILFHKYTPNCSESIPNLESGVAEDSCYRDLDPCQDVQCFNNGSCHPSGWIEFICKCAEGYIGRLCQMDIDYCVNATCLNGGVCVDGLLSYTCKCPISHTGKNCETDVNFCEAGKCENNGTCIDDVFGYSCTCPASHTGKLCEIDINYCNTSIAKRDILCENGGTCLDGLLDYSCLCPDTHSGDLCEDEISNAGYIVSVVIISGGLVLSGGVLTYAVYNVITTASKAQNMVGYFPFD